MHLLKIQHYAEKSFQSKPAFVLKMSDNKLYVSHGCVFEQIKNNTFGELKNKYYIEKHYITELLASSSIATNQIINADYMFSNCTSLIK